jgi:hypothetical protein
MLVEKSGIKREKTKIVGIRQSKSYSENPFMSGSIVQIVGKKKRYSIAAKSDVITSREGVVKGGIEHTIVRLVDDSKFVKVFSDGVAGMYDLKSGGGKVFRYLFSQVQKFPNVDRIYLYFLDAVEEPWSISKTVFFRGMAELLEKGFIARSESPNMFYLNPAMIWNGDRFRFVNEYRRISKNQQAEIEIIDSDGVITEVKRGSESGMAALDAASQQRLDV